MKGIMEEGAKIKKNYKQLELHLSYWLNLIYLENMIPFLKEHHNSISAINDEVNHAILAYGTMKLRTALAGVLSTNEFLQNILAKVEETIPNITFDEKVIELARYYHQKCRSQEIAQFKKLSSDSFGSFYGSDERYHRRYCSYVTDSTEGETTCNTMRRTNKASDHSFREAVSREEAIPVHHINNLNPFMTNSNVTIPSGRSASAMRKSLTINNEQQPLSAKAVKISLNDILRDKRLY